MWRIRMHRKIVWIVTFVLVWVFPPAAAEQSASEPKTTVSATVPSIVDSLNNTSAASFVEVFCSRNIEVWSAIGSVAKVVKIYHILGNRNGTHAQVTAARHHRLR
jgi:hypothetical protein